MCKTGILTTLCRSQAFETFPRGLANCGNMSIFCVNLSSTVKISADFYRLG